jgi:hypothetical protein
LHSQDDNIEDISNETKHGNRIADDTDDDVLDDSVRLVTHWIVTPDPRTN